MAFDNPKTAFEAITESTTLARPKENWIILYKDQPIQLKDNGKNRWNKPQHALCALTRAWEDAERLAHPYYTDKTVPGELRRKWLAEFKEWRKTNIRIVRQEVFECKIEPAELNEEERAYLASCGPEDTW